MPTHTVQPGDCLSSIADHYGFFWQTLWEHPKNARLKQRGRRPNTLEPGDEVHIPEKQTKQYTRRTGARHRFQKRGVPVKLRVQICSEGRPRAGEPFVLDVEGAVTHGQTDGDGYVEAVIRPGARRGTLTVGDGRGAETYALDLGALPPIDSVAGMQERLRNLGYRLPDDGQLGEETLEALRAFQAASGLVASGRYDDATRERLREAHGG